MDLALQALLQKGPGADTFDVPEMEILVAAEPQKPLIVRGGLAQTPGRQFRPGAEQAGGEPAFEPAIAIGGGRGPGRGAGQGEAPPERGPGGILNIVGGPEGLGGVVGSPPHPERRSRTNAPVSGVRRSKPVCSRQWWASGSEC